MNPLSNTASVPATKTPRLILANAESRRPEYLDDEMEDWRNLVRKEGTLGARIPMLRLLERHDFIIRHWATRFSKRGPHSSEYEDNYCSARAGAMMCYLQYDPERGMSLSSYTYFSVHKALLKAEESEGLVHCPSRAVPVRHLITGKFERHQEKRRAVLRAHGLEDEHEAALMFGPLAPLGSLDGFNVNAQGALDDGGWLAGSILDHLADDEESILDRVAAEDALNALPDDQRAAILLQVEQEFSHGDISSAMNRSKHQVNNLLVTARRALKELGVGA